MNKQFEERLAFLKSIFGEPDAPTYPNVRVVEHTKCKGKSHVLEMLEQLQNKGAEGLMLVFRQNVRDQAFFDPP